MFNTAIYTTEEISNLQKTALAERAKYVKTLSSDSVTEQTEARDSLAKAVDAYNGAVAQAVYEWCNTQEKPIVALLQGAEMPEMVVKEKRKDGVVESVTLDSKHRLVNLSEYVGQMPAEIAPDMAWKAMAEELREVACGHVGMELTDANVAKFATEFEGKFRMKYNPAARKRGGDNAKARYTKSAVKAAIQTLANTLLGEGYVIRSCDVAGIVYTIAKVDGRDAGAYKFPTADQFIRLTLTNVLTSIVGAAVTFKYSGSKSK